MSVLDFISLRPFEYICPKRRKFQYAQIPQGLSKQQNTWAKWKKKHKKTTNQLWLKVWLFGDAYEFINSYMLEILISKHSITLDQFPLDISTLDHCPQPLFEGVTFLTAFQMVCLYRATHPTPKNRDCTEGKLAKLRNLLFLFTILTESGKES